MTLTFKSIATASVILASLVGGPAAAMADDVDAKVQATYDDIQKTFGGVPTFVKQIPKAALPAFWQMEKDLELSQTTALPPKTKALISLAVAAQIPCHYCVWADTMTAKQLGASDEEIGEAVAMAGLTRTSSTMLNGLQVDFDQFKKEMGGGQ